MPESPVCEYRPTDLVPLRTSGDLPGCSDPFATRCIESLTPPAVCDDAAVDDLRRGLRERGEVVARMQAWLDATQDRGEHQVTVLGRTFEVLPGVFSPRFYPETAFYAMQVVDAVRRSDRFLDMGCGVGVNAVLAAMKGARVVACDVNERAVETTQRNAARHRVNVDVRVSDIFSALAEDEVFDVVYWNIPFTFRDPTARLSPLEEAVFDPGYRKNLTFVRDVGRHVTDDGLVLIGVSSTLGELPVTQAAAAAAGLDLEVRATTLEEATQPPTRLELLAGRPRR